MKACVADTSAIIAFSSVGQLDVLRSVFSIVWIVPEVFNEIVTQGEGWIAAVEAQKELIAGTWMRRATICEDAIFESLYHTLGNSGETEAIWLALNRKIPVLLDEWRGRKVAAKVGVETTGTLGVLKKAKAQGTITQVGPIVRAMMVNGIYFKPDLISAFLADCGEI